MALEKADKKSGGQVAPQSSEQAQVDLKAASINGRGNVATETAAEEGSAVRFESSTQYAKHALERLSTVYNVVQRIHIADRYLETLAEKADTKDERRLAATVRAAVHNKDFHRGDQIREVEHLIELQRSGLDAIARGLKLPIEQVLANVGGRAVAYVEAQMEKIRSTHQRHVAMESYPDGPNIGAVFLQNLKSLSRKGSVQEKIISTALSDSAQVDQNMSASYIQLAAFGLVKDGIGSSLGREYSRYAQQAMRSLGSDEDRLIVCRSALRAISRYSKSEEHRVLAADALDADRSKLLTVARKTFREILGAK